MFLKVSFLLATYAALVNAIPKHESLQIGVPVDQGLLRNFQMVEQLEQEAESASGGVALGESAVIELDAKYHMMMDQMETEEEKKHPDWGMFQTYGELAQKIQDNKIQLEELLKEDIREETRITTSSPHVLLRYIQLWKERAAMMVVPRGNVLDLKMTGWNALPLAAPSSQDDIKAYHGTQNVALSKAVDKESTEFFTTVGGHRSGKRGSFPAGGTTAKDTDLITFRAKAFFKNGHVLTPVFHKTQAIQVWDTMFPDDQFGAVGTVPTQLYKVYNSSGTNNTITLITSIRYMAQFYGTAHVKHSGTVHESTIDKLATAFQNDLLMGSASFGDGNCKAQQIADSLPKTVTVQYYAYTFGIPCECWDDVVNATLRGHQQNAAGDHGQAASRESADATVTDWQAKKERMVHVATQLEMGQQRSALKVTSSDALVQAFKMFKQTVAATDATVDKIQGAPYQYGVTSYSKADIARNILAQHHAGWMDANAGSFVSFGSPGKPADKAAAPITSAHNAAAPAASAEKGAAPVASAEKAAAPAEKAAAPVASAEIAAAPMASAEKALLPVAAAASCSADAACPSPSSVPTEAEARVAGVFAYGTLRADRSPTGDDWGLMTTVKEQTGADCVWAQAAVPGFALFQKRGVSYPFAVEAEGGRIVGTLLRWPTEEASALALALADRIEGYQPGGGGLYERRLVNVPTAAGATVPAFMYFQRVPVEALANPRQYIRFDSGDWLADEWYFAYGSNLNLQRMQERMEGVADIKEERLVRLGGFSLAFDKRAGQDGEGYANIVPAAGQQVYGVAYRLEAGGLARLDVFEGVAGGHYRREWVDLAAGRLDDGTFRADPAGALRACAYVAEPGARGPDLRPSRAYLEHLLAREGDLPDTYQAMLRATPTSDPSGKKRK